MNYIYDASFVGAIILPDEKNPDVDKINNSIDENDMIYIPQMLWYEVTNILNNVVRRKRISSNEVIHLYKVISAIKFTTDFETGINYSKKLWELCIKYNLSSYDAAYLELADRKKAVLCTLDENLINAAKTHGVTIIS